MIEGEVIVRAGEWKRRRAAAHARRAAWEAGSERRNAISTLINASEERKRRENFVAAMKSEHAAVVAEIGAAETRLKELRTKALPAAEQAVEAAQARFDALTSDLDHARSVMEAENVLASMELPK